MITEDGREMAWMANGKSGVIAGWAGVVKPVYESATQARPRGGSSATKGECYRRQGLEPQLSLKGKTLHSFNYFRDKLVEHAECHGMDTILYLPDPADTTRMIIITTYYSKFTIDSARDAMTKLTPLWDQCDWRNNRDLMACLMNSLDSRSEQLVLDHKLDTDDTFVVIWMIMLRSIASVSITRHTDLKDKLRGLEPAQFSGHNIFSFGLAVKRICQELQDADQWEHYLTLSLVKNLLKGGGASNELWRIHFLELVPKLNRALLTIAHLEKKRQWAHMKQEKLLWTDVLATAYDVYKSQLDNAEWIPARGARDSKRLPSSYRHSANQGVATTSPTAPNAQALVPRSQSNGANNGNCFGCGSPDHHIKDCPKRNQASNGGNKPRQGAKGGGNKSRNPYAAPNTEGHKDKRTGDVKGQPVFVRTINGKQMKWCQKCSNGKGRWTTTHSTGEHVSEAQASAAQKGRKPRKPPRKSSKKKVRGSVALVPDPSVWIAAAGSDDEEEETQRQPQARPSSKLD